MGGEGAQQDSSSNAPTQRQDPGGDEGLARESRLGYWPDAAVEALLCSDSDAEVVDEDQDGSKLRARSPSASQSGAGAALRRKFIRDADHRRDAQLKSQGKLSRLALLNLRGLIELGLLANHLQQTHDLDPAIEQCEQAIEDLRQLKQEQDVVDEVLTKAKQRHGIASLTMLEELLDNLQKIKLFRDAQSDQ